MWNKIDLENKLINKDIELKQQIEGFQNKLIICMSEYIEKINTHNHQ